MPRQNRKFSRRPPLKVSRERALIVCEEEKTEPNYIRDFVHHLGLTSADVRVCGEECGSDPRSIYRYAMKVFEADSDYDHVFCVFDQDGHANFVETCARIAETRLANKKKIYCINSNPCFEYWILLHYLFTTAPIIAVGGKSAGERAVSELKKYFPEYVKGHRSVFGMTNAHLATAVTRSKEALRHAVDTGSNNPLTQMHILVECLSAMSKARV